MKRFINILCLVDPSQDLEPALARAVALAEINQALLTVVEVIPRLGEGSVIPFDGPITVNLQREMLDQRKQQLEDCLEPYTNRVKLESKILVGTPFLEIIREVLRNKRDLVVKVADHHHWLNRLLGSDDMNLLRKCPCPVWIFKPQAPRTYRRILAAVDVDYAYPRQEIKPRQALNRHILEMASSLALAESAELHIAHAWDAFGESALRYGAFTKRPKKEVDAYVERVLQRHTANLDDLMRDVVSHVGQDALDYLKPKTHLVKGWARQEIPELTKRIGADLIVMGTVARTGISGFFMGNTAEDILNRIDCAVLAIKPPGFKTPVTLQE